MRSRTQTVMPKKQHGLAHAWYLCLFLTTISAVVCISLFVSNRNATIQKENAIAQERKKFQGYSVLTKQLGEQIAAKTNPTQAKQVEYCDRTNLKFEEGGLSCESNYYMLYGGATKVQADEIDESIKNILANRSGYNGKKGGESWEKVRIGSGSFDDSACLYETLWYDDHVSLSLAYPFDKNIPGAVVYLVCSDSALESYYKYIDY